MNDFLHDLPTNPILQMALLTGVLCSVACGVIGSYVVVRRITYIAGAISHSVLGGLGAAAYLKVVWGWDKMHPLYGAITVALLSAIIIGLISLRAREREDTVISAVWAIGMAVGVVFIQITPGYGTELMSYLFGNILLVNQGDLWLLVGLDALVVAFGGLFYNQFLAICFDEEFARLRGLNVELYYLLLLCLTALTVVLMISLVGVILVIALLTLPVAVAGHFCRTLWQLMLAAMVLSALFCNFGLAISYGPNLPPGATAILLAGATYLLVAVAARLLRWRAAPG